MRSIVVIKGLLFSAAALLLGCNGTKTSATEKITEIPITTTSADAKASVLKGLEYGDDGDQQMARIYYTKAIGQDSSLGIAYILRSSTSTSNGEAMPDMTMAKDHLSNASDWEKWYYDFQASFFNDDYTKRLAVVKKIADAYPDAARAQVDLGNTYLGANDFANARAAFLKAVDINPSWAGAQNAMAISYLFNEPKDFKKAETYAAKAVELRPNSPGVHITLGDCYRAEDDLAKAKDEYSKAITLAPNASGGFYKRGHTESFIGNYDEARKDYMEGGKYDSLKTNAAFSYANTYVYGNDPATSMKWMMDQYNKVDSGSGTNEKKLQAKMSMLTYCAQIATHINNLDMLKDVVTKIDALSPSMENLQPSNEAKLNQKANTYFWDAMLLMEEGKYDEAMKKDEEMKALVQPVNDPLKDVQYEFAMGAIDMKQKKYKDAVTHFEKSDPNVIYFQYMLAMANEEAGNKDKAKEMYKKIAVYNFNDVGYALIRGDAKKKAVM